MKKILLFLFIFVIIPYIIINIYNRKEFIYIENNYVRVKINNKIIKVNINDYLVGVIAGEMPLSFSDEAIKAQIVASRTYVLYHINKNNDYDIDNTINTQVYKTKEDLKKMWKKKYEKNYKRIVYLINMTNNNIITYNDKIIDALFFSTSCGKTENSEDVFNTYVPYLRSVKINDYKNSPFYYSIKKIKKKDIISILKLDSFNFDNIKLEHINDSARIKKIYINNVMYDGYFFARKFNLNSNCFFIENEGNYIKFTVNGYGHGVGMSQYGAEFLSQQGYDYKDILKYFYKNINFKKIKYSF